jgi:hypothetical protein
MADIAGIAITHQIGRLPPVRRCAARRWRFSRRIGRPEHSDDIDDEIRLTQQNKRNHRSGRPDRWPFHNLGCVVGMRFGLHSCL